MRMRNPKDTREVIDKCDFYFTKENKFENNNEVHLEIGMGKGNFIIGMAKAFPNINFIGMEKYEAVASIAIKKIREENLSNIKVMVMDVVKSEEILKGLISKIYLNFSDPWPKDRHAKRRLTHENQLKVYDKLFAGICNIEMKTDNDDLFEYSLISLKKYGYILNKVIYDLHNEDRFNVKTEYEEKFSKEGIKIKFLKAEK